MGIKFWDPKIDQIRLAILDRLVYPCAVIDTKQPNCPFIYCNHMFYEITGYTSEELKGNAFDMILDDDIFKGQLESIKTSGSYYQDIEIECKRKNDETFEGFLRINRLDNGETFEGIYLCFLHDITDNKKLKEELQGKEVLLNAVAKVNHHLLINKASSKAINKSLGILGKALRIDRVYVFKMRAADTPDEILVDQKFEWVTDGIEPQIDNPDLQGFPLMEMGFKRWIEAFWDDEHVSGFVSAFPEQEREILLAQEIISLLAVPIYVDNTLWGFVGFDDCSYGRTWSEGEVQILKATANYLGTSINNRRIQEELEIANVKAIEASKAKSNFLANMSHEIRTPMNIILGISEVLSETPLNSEQENYVKIFNKATKELIELLNSILDLSKIEAQQMNLYEQEFNLIDLLTDVTNFLSFKASEKGITLKLDVDSKLNINILADNIKLRQVLINLVGNAIKFTEEGYVEIKVRSEIEDDRRWMHVGVRDTGVGIPKEKRELVFEDFTQVDDSITKKYGGTGLGLAISRRLVELMGGETSLESELDVGTTMMFKIPIRLADASKQSEIDDLPEKPHMLLLVPNNANKCILFQALINYKLSPELVETYESAVDKYEISKHSAQPYNFILLDDSTPSEEVEAFAAYLIKAHMESKNEIPFKRMSDIRTSLREEYAENLIESAFLKPITLDVIIQMIFKTMTATVDSSPEIKAEQMDAPLQKAQVLLVDDSSDNRMLIKLYMKKMPVEITEAVNGQEAVDKFKSGQFDIVLMDMQMPVMDGIEATKNIRAYCDENHLANPVIVALTAFAFKEDRDKTIIAGCDRHISKPIYKAQFIEEMKEILEERS